MPLQVLFDFFSSTLESEITLAKSMGNYETGEGCLAGSLRISLLNCPEPLHAAPASFCIRAAGSRASWQLADTASCIKAVGQPLVVSSSHCAQYVTTCSFVACCAHHTSGRFGATRPHGTAGIVRLNARSAQLKRRDILHVDPQTGEGMHP